MSYESIMAGTEVQAVREQINTIRAELFGRLELLTGLEAKAQKLTDDDVLRAVATGLSIELTRVEDYIVDKIVAKAEKEGLA